MCFYGFPCKYKLINAVFWYRIHLGQWLWQSTHGSRQSGQNCDCSRTCRWVCHSYHERPTASLAGMPSLPIYPLFWHPVHECFYAIFKNPFHVRTRFHKSVCGIFQLYPVSILYFSRFLYCPGFLWYFCKKTFYHRSMYYMECRLALPFKPDSSIFSKIWFQPNGYGHGHSHKTIFALRIILSGCYTVSFLYFIWYKNEDR